MTDTFHEEYLQTCMHSRVLTEILAYVMIIRINSRIERMSVAHGIYGAALGL